MGIAVTSTENKGAAQTKLLVGLIILIVVAIAGVLIYRHAHHSTPPTALSETYCNEGGGVCISYPQSWSAHTNNDGVTITNPSTGTGVLYTHTLISVADPCSKVCTFSTISALISNGFSNGNNIGGVYQNGPDSYTPEYFLMATTQVLNDGLRLGTTTTLNSTGVEPTFTNEANATYTQSLQVTPPAQTTFTTMAAARAWLTSSDAQTAEAIVNSARAS
jgi:hypothetical protein